MQRHHFSSICLLSVSPLRLSNILCKQKNRFHSNKKAYEWKICFCGILVNFVREPRKQEDFTEHNQRFAFLCGDWNLKSTFLICKASLGTVKPHWCMQNCWMFESGLLKLYCQWNVETSGICENFNCLWMSFLFDWSQRDSAESVWTIHEFNRIWGYKLQPSSNIANYAD